MGVPAFFRWLSKKYPSVIVNCVEHKVSAPQKNTVDYGTYNSGYIPVFLSKLIDNE